MRSPSSDAEPLEPDSTLPMESRLTEVVTPSRRWPKCRDSRERLSTGWSLAIKRLSPRPGRTLWLVALPLAAMAFDYLENVLAWLALASYPDPIATTHLLGVASAAKTTTSWAAGLLLLAALAAKRFGL